MRCLLLLLVSLLPLGQVLAQATPARPTSAQSVQSASISRQQAAVRKLGLPLREVKLEEVPAREALKWWSATADVPVHINWNALELEGIVPDTRVNLKLQMVPAQRVLLMIVNQMAPDTRFILMLDDGYLEILSREQANRRTVTRMYDVNDLLVQIPNFDDAPAFDLSSALSSGGTRGGSGGSGGGSGGSSGGLFSSSSGGGSSESAGPSKRERGEALADLIRDMVEPDIWTERGGEHSSIRYFNGQLIVKAPQYVQQQIGQPTLLAGRVRAATQRQSGPAKANVTATGSSTATPRPSPVAAVQSEQAKTKVSGISGGEQDAATK